MAILNLLCYGSTCFFVLPLAAEFLAIPGRDSGNRTIRDSVPLRY